MEAAVYYLLMLEKFINSKQKTLKLCHVFRQYFKRLYNNTKKKKQKTKKKQD